MKNIKLIFVFLCLPALFSCSQIKTAVNMATSSNDLVQKFPAVDRPRDIQNSTPEPNIGDEKAVVVSVSSRDSYYVGMNQYPLETLNEVINKRFFDSPAQKGKIYLNASASTDFINVVRAFDAFRKSDVDEVGLMVDSAKKDAPFSILKIKLFPEPKPEPAAEEEAMFKYPILRVQKNGAVSFAQYDKKTFELKNEKPEIKPDEDNAKIQQLVKDKNTATISIKAPRSAGYGRVIRLIDAAYGAGATTVYLIIDDMEE